MSRTPHINMTRKSYVKLPDIDNKDKTRQMLDNFTIKRRSCSKAVLMESDKKKYQSPNKTNFMAYQYVIITGKSYVIQIDKFKRILIKLDYLTEIIPKQIMTFLPYLPISDFVMDIACNKQI